MTRYCYKCIESPPRPSPLHWISLKRLRRVYSTGRRKKKKRIISSAAPKDKVDINVTPEILTCNNSGGDERKQQTLQYLHQQVSREHEVLYFSGCHVVGAQSDAQASACRKDGVNEESATSVSEGCFRCPDNHIIL